MNNDLLKYICEYFKTFNPKEYTIYVDGKQTKWCSFNHNRVVWCIPTDTNEDNWRTVYDWELTEVIMTATAMIIKTKDIKEYMFIAKVKAKEEKAKDLILKTKNALYARHIDDVLKHLDELKALMDE